MNEMLYMRVCRACGALALDVPTQAHRWDEAEGYRVARLLEVLASRVERGIDTYPASLADALDAARAVRWVDIAVVGRGGERRDRSERDTSLEGIRPLSDRPSLPCGARRKKDERRITQRARERIAQRREMLERVMLEASGAGVAVVLLDLLDRCGLAQSSHTVLLADLHAVAKKLGVNMRRRLERVRADAPMRSVVWFEPDCRAA